MWRYTGSWDDAVNPSYTIHWGPESGTDPHPASTHPPLYSITGSNNTGTIGRLSIIAGTKRGWILCSYSGAEVLGVEVKNVKGERLPGTWSHLTQTWTPAERAPTVDATWTLTVTVAAGNLDDVNAHFIDELFPPPPPLPPGMAPPPPVPTTAAPTAAPTSSPAPTAAPTSSPAPTSAPSAAPTATLAPTAAPTGYGWC